MATSPLRILFDIVHPAHVHFYKHIISSLEEKGVETTIVAREKDVTLDLLNSYNLPHTSVGRSGQKNMLGQLGELLNRDWQIWKLAKEFKPDIICSRSPAGVQVARLTGAKGIFDTDDGHAAGIHYWAAAPFAHHITTPTCITENCGKKHIKYPGFKQSAYLHPDHFTPNNEIYKLLGLAENEPYFLVRFVAMEASHDRNERGLSMDARHSLIKRLQSHGRVFLTAEGEIPERWRGLQIKIPPHRIHDALAFATILIGDSHTMTAEAAFLGTPSLRLSSFTGRLTCIEELEHRYHLTNSFLPENSEGFFNKLDSWLGDPAAVAEVAAGHHQLLADTKNIADWYVNFLLKSVKTGHS
ncbi:MAG: DUF354 domain-containing protein [Magnetococcales bacterium]|nr:DUF354 domain-containing protein [Magnetococcales bacterium]